ncbi:arabinose efflux permease [Longilinea arvoryzae]|uniref:Arabinose efflux permease n=1 Tax=Longilinea arvoryzae TaxID=360412 RepID=A0A0S7BIG3_9CHLR|nr:MFS transporter [Longilinea arvoryzae]GAP13557.1 arabinose efflux permease [Longilinea arvoryzae]
MNDKSRNKILLVLFLGVLMGALDIAIVAPALPSIQKYFGVGERILAWTFTIYVLFNLIGTPLMAKLSDKFSRRFIYILDVVLFVLGSIVVALSPQKSFAVMLAGRALQGFGAGGIFPVASAVIGDTFPPENRGRALGLIGAVFGLAFLVGPVLGGVILSITTWQWLFIINLPIALVVIVMGWRLLPSKGSGSQLRFDWNGLLILSVLLASLTYALNQIDTQHFFSSLVSVRVLPFLLLGLVLMLVFPTIERKASDPIVNMSLFHSRQIRLSSFLSAGAGLGESGLSFMPALAVAALPGIINSHTSSYMILPVVLAMSVGSPLVGRLMDRFGSKVMVISGTLLLAVGMMLLSTSAISETLWGFILSGVVIGFGLSSLLGAPMRYIMLNETTARDRTSAQGLISLFTSIGQLASSALIGAVAASKGGGVAGYGGAYRVVGFMAVIMIVLALGLKNRQHELLTVQNNQLDTQAES